MNFNRKIRLLKFEAKLYETYASKIEQVKAVLKSFDGKQVNIRITNMLGKEVPQDDCSIWTEKEKDVLRIYFTSKTRYVNIGDGNQEVAYASNDITVISCVDAISEGRLNYRIAEPQIDNAVAVWINEANEYKNTDYDKLLAEYKAIADTIKAFRESRSDRIRNLLELDFKINYHGCR